MITSANNYSFAQPIFSKKYDFLENGLKLTFRKRDHYET